MGKFANRTTTVKGFLIDTEKQTFTPFEEVVSYVRGNDKAVKLVSEKLGVSDNTVITVTEIINEKAKPVVYNTGKIFDLAQEVFVSKEEAEEYAKANGLVVKEVTRYTISAHLWTRNEDVYATCVGAYEANANYTKANARQFVKMRYEETHEGVTVIGVIDEKKEPYIAYATIDSEELAACIVK